MIKFLSIPNIFIEKPNASSGEFWVWGNTFGVEWVVGNESSVEFVE